MGIQIFLIGIVIWLLVISIFLVRMISHYNRLVDGTSREGLKEILDRILTDGEKAHVRIDSLDKELKAQRLNGALHIQKMGIVRFNPFSDTGGSQSFSLALLDGNESGLVMTSLYGRTGNRWYIKEVRHGQGKELQLSKEEEAAIKRAQTIAAGHI